MHTCIIMVKQIINIDGDIEKTFDHQKIFTLLKTNKNDSLSKISLLPFISLYFLLFLHLVIQNLTFPPANSSDIRDALGIGQI